MTVAKDHTGRIYPSMRKMAAAWSVPYKTVLARLDLGWSIEQALTFKKYHHRRSA